MSALKILFIMLKKLRMYLHMVNYKTQENCSNLVIGCIIFVRLVFLHLIFDVVEHLQYPIFFFTKTKNYMIPITGQSEHSEHCLDTRAVLLRISICQEKRNHLERKFQLILFQTT